MKLFKNTLVVVALIATGFISARPAKKTTPTRPVIQQTVVQEPVAQVEDVTTVAGPTYTAMFANIKSMPSAQVINNASNTFQPNFVKSIVTNSNLSRTEAEALLQAGVNMHAQWSGRDQQDKEKLQSLMMQATQNAQQVASTIDDALGRITGKGAADLKKAQDALAQMQKNRENEDAVNQAFKNIQKMDFYDSANNLLKHDYLQSKINVLLSNPNNRAARLDTLRAESLNRMLPEWKKRGVNEKTFRAKLNDQINNMYNNQVRLVSTGKATTSGTALTSPSTPITGQGLIGTVRPGGQPKKTGSIYDGLEVEQPEQPILFGTKEWEAAKRDREAELRALPTPMNAPKENLLGPVVKQNDRFKELYESAKDVDFGNEGS